MVSERELIGLLYRADWTNLTLSGTATGAEPVVDTFVTVQSDQPLGRPWKRNDDERPPWRREGAEPPHWLFGRVPPRMFERVEEEAWRGRRGRAWTFAPSSDGGDCALSVAPGRRFRADGADGSWALGCDGTRMRHSFRDLSADTTVQFGFSGSERPQPPYRSLLAPSWLLTGYSLALDDLDDEVTVAGRTGVRIRGTVRAVADRPSWVGRKRLGRSAGAAGLFAPIPRWLSNIAAWDEQVEAVVDTELGILLRCSRWSDDASRKDLRLREPVLRFRGEWMDKSHRVPVPP